MGEGLGLGGGGQGGGGNKLFYIIGPAKTDTPADRGLRFVRGMQGG